MYLKQSMVQTGLWQVKNGGRPRDRFRAHQLPCMWDTWATCPPFFNWCFLLVIYFSLRTKGIPTTCLLLNCVCICSWNDHLLFIKLCRHTHTHSRAFEDPIRPAKPRSSTQSFIIQLSGSQLGHLAVNGDVILAPGILWVESKGSAGHPLGCIASDSGGLSRPKWQECHGSANEGWQL